MRGTTSKTKVNVTNVPASDSKNEEGEIEMAKKNETIASEPITIRLNEKGVSKMRLWGYLHIPPKKYISVF